MVEKRARDLIIGLSDLGMHRNEDYFSPNVIFFLNPNFCF